MENLRHAIQTLVALAACGALAGCCVCNEPPEPTCGGYKFGTECTSCCAKSNHLGATVNDRCKCYEKPWEDYDYTAEGKSQKLKPWDGSKPLVCEDREELTYKGVKARLPGKVAVTAKGRCRLVLEDVDIDGKIAIRATERANVSVTQSKLNGSKIGFEADERAQASLSSTRLTAPVGLKVNTRAQVRVIDGSIKGKSLAVDVSDRGGVTLVEVKVKGEKRKTGRKATLTEE